MNVHSSGSPSAPMVTTSTPSAMPPILSSPVSSANLPMASSSSSSFVAPATLPPPLPLPSSSSSSSSTPTPPNVVNNLPMPTYMFNNNSSNPLGSSDWMNQICLQVVNDMNLYGICVIDNFLGEAQGDSILNEVKSLYEYGIFQEGQLVRKVNRPRTLTQTIRSDKIVWIDGSESQCGNIGFLIQTLDSILYKCNTMDNNGLFSKYNINTRTKAMIACYPGCGTRYVKHVDNPNSDGRRITSIYYLNKGWEVERDGGLLRMYPVGYEDHVADISPLFDRVIFFWSDRRNPHEVQPAFSIRFAITVWYFDDEERNQAMQSTNSLSSSTSSPSTKFITGY